MPLGTSMTGAPKTVLLVTGDDRVANEVAAQLDGSKGVQAVQRVETLREALELATDRSFAAVLLDLELRDSTGLLTLRRFRASVPGLPIVALIEPGDAFTGRVAQRRGAEDHLAKESRSWELLPRILGYLEDRVLAREQLLHAARLQTLGEIAAGIAHELNNPIAVTLLNQDAVQQLCGRISAQLPRGADGQAARDLLQQLRSVTERNEVALQRVRRVVQGLLPYTRLDRDSSFETYAVSNLLRDACRLMGCQVRHSAELELVVGDLPMLSLDVQKMMQVCCSLIANALGRVSAPGGPTEPRIVVTATRQAGQVQISIDDNGPAVTGLASGRAAPFEEAWCPQHAPARSACLDVVRQHGGSLRAQAGAMGGVRFEINLPVQQTLLPPADSLEPEAMASLPPARVLVIDDEPAMLDAYRRTLGMDFDVESFSSASEALGRIQDGATFNLVLCDLMMPDMDGAAFYLRLSEVAPAQVPRLVFVTGGALSQRCRIFVERVAERVVYKPIAPDDLRALVREYAWRPLPQRRCIA